ncbi:MAG: hypothetical protein ACOH2H_16010 [Cypionkella sp.]
MTDKLIISCCPFCGTAPTIKGAWGCHPMADCLLSDEILFAWSVEDQVRRWNQRSRVMTGAAAQSLLDACPNPIFDILKPVLIGEFKQTIEDRNEDGEECRRDIRIEWSVTKEIILAALTELAVPGGDLQ